MIGLHFRVRQYKSASQHSIILHPHRPVVFTNTPRTHLHTISLHRRSLLPNNLDNTPSHQHTRPRVLIPVETSYFPAITDRPSGICWPLIDCDKFTNKDSTKLHIQSDELLDPYVLPARLATDHTSSLYPPLQPWTTTPTSSPMPLYLQTKMTWSTLCSTSSPAEIPPHQRQ